MKVLKFGGSSLASAEKIFGVSKIINQETQNQPVCVVLSAPQGVTNSLVDIVTNLNKKTESINLVQSLKMKLGEIRQELVSNFRDESSKQLYSRQLETDIKREFSRLDRLVEGAKLLGFCPQQTCDEILSLGESISILFLSVVFQVSGVNTTLIDPTKFLIVKNDSGDLIADISISRNKFSQLYQQRYNVSLMPGFVGSTPKGQVITLGRNGSDYSAAILAVCADASSCEIWTDVDGVYNADPRLVENAKLVDSMTFDEAIELSYFGAKILHPKTIAPLSASNIPCLIKNTLAPDRPGTIISHNASDVSNVKAIASLENVAIINLSGLGMRTKVGMSSRIFSTLAKGEVKVILISQSSAAYRISICVPEQQLARAKEYLTQEFELELENARVDPISCTKQLSVVSLVGDNMQKQKGIAAKFFSSLSQAGVNIIAIAQDSSERSISAVIRSQRTDDAVKVCHQNLFIKRSTIDAFVIGCGNVGRELINQIAKQQTFLLGRNVQLNIYGIASSKKLLLDAKGIELDPSWKQRLNDSSIPFSLPQINRFVEQNHLLNPVIIDATSSHAIAMSYADYLQANYHVVAANKKANTTTIAYYQKLRKIAQANKRRFLYETNVGAGLPVIDNLQSLLGAGDKLIAFEGILSGSLSYIFGLLHQGMSLSEATQKAQDLGYTEPNPADDLSGLDVARKLLIIAREAGLALELDDIQLESIIPKELAGIENSDEFMKALPSLDAEIALLVKSAEADNKVLRYVARISNGTCQVKILSVSIEHPMYAVSGGENALAMHTEFYQPTPFVIRGYGAGAEVTAAGLFADVLRTLVWDLE